MKATIRLLFILIALHGSVQGQVENFAYDREWATFFGADIFDNQGNAIVMGVADGAFYNALVPYVNNPENPGTRFLAKLNADQTIGFVTKFGPSTPVSDNNFLPGITVDEFGNIYLFGHTKETEGIATSGAFIENFSANWSDPYDVYYPEPDVTITMPPYPCSDGYIMKFSPQGIKLWGSYYNGNKDVTSVGVRVHEGFIYFRGLTTSYEGIATPGTYIDEWPEQAPQHQRVGFVQQLDAVSGLPTWGTYTSATTESGNYTDTNFTVNSEGTTYLHINNQVVGLSTSGTFAGIFSADESSNDLDAMRSDEYGNFYVLGRTQSNAIGTPGTYKPQLTSAQEYFIVKYSAMGVKLWGTYVTEALPLGSLPLGFHPYKDDIYVGFNTQETGLATPGAFQHQNNGGYDGIFMKLDGIDGGLRWMSYYGGNGYENTIGQIGFDQFDNMYLSGSGGTGGGVVSLPEQIVTENALFASPFEPSEFSFVVKFNYDNEMSVPENASNEMAVYPNPATDSITLHTPLGLPSQTVINIFDTLGRKIISTNTEYPTINSIDVSSLSKGFYILAVGNNNFIQDIRFLKK